METTTATTTVDIATAANYEANAVVEDLLKRDQGMFDSAEVLAVLDLVDAAVSLDTDGDPAKLAAGVTGLHPSRIPLGRLEKPPSIVAVAGDVASEEHRLALRRVVADLGGIDAVVHNASRLGPSPQPTLDSYPLDVLRDVYA